MKLTPRLIQHKIIRAILITSTTVLFLTGLAYVIYEFLTFRDTTVDRMKVLGEVLANNSTAALAFDSQEEAYEILSALRAQEHIITAALYDEEGVLFSKYPESTDDQLLPAALLKDGHYFMGTYLHGYQAVILGSKRIGTLYLKYDVKVLGHRFLLFGFIAFLIFILSLLLAYLISSKLQQKISNPIIALAHVARAISIHQDYSVRAVKQSEDEIGLLTEAFNQMLIQIEQQDLALRDSEEFNRTLVDSSPDAVSALDLEGRLLSINPQGQEMFQIADFDRVWHQKWETLWAEEIQPEVAAAVERARRGETGHFQGFSPIANGIPKWWDVMIAPVFGGTGQVERLVSVTRDISKLKELEQQKDEFLGIASHELKTPVTSIKAFTQILKRKFMESEDTMTVDLLGKMEVQINKLTKLITDLLDVTKIEQGKLQFTNDHFDFNGLVSETVEELQRTTARHQIIQELDATRLVYGDRDRIGQVLTNFLSNAIKYSPKADRIIVGTKVLANEIVLSVRDFGVGLSQEELQKIFERFYRVEGTGYETFPGLGLGLYISAGIVHRHNGKIWVESELGRGSTFFFSLPLSQEEEAGNSVIQ